MRYELCVAGSRDSTRFARPLRCMYYMYMLLHSTRKGVPLSELGISIPAAPDRKRRILDALRTRFHTPGSIDGLLEQAEGGYIGKDDLLLAHSKRYVDRIYSDELENVLIEVFELIDKSGRYHRYDPSSAKRPLSDMFDPGLTGLSGGYECCTKALETGFCFYFGGGAHHAHPDFGHGFCMLNDIVVPLRKLQREGRISTAWVVDVDAHKGDGTAACTRGDDSIVTLSVHMASGWPLDGPEYDGNGELNPAWIPSDIDVPIEPGEEAEYNSRLERALRGLEDRPKPDIALVLLGADPYESDALPSTAPLSLTLDQMTERDMNIYSFLENRSIPGAWYMAGGYGLHAWEPYVPFLEHVIEARL